MIIKYRGDDYRVFLSPRKSTRKDKKLMVGVVKVKSGRRRIIHFGQAGYADFTMHKNPLRRKLYLARSSGIKDRFGNLTKDNPFSANYWARRILW